MKAGDGKNNAISLVAITGGFGFLGSVIVRKLLRRSYRVRLLQHNNTEIGMFDRQVDVVQGDIRNIDDVRTLCRGVDAIIHVAAFISIVKYHKKQLHNVNVQGTKNILAICQEQQIKKLVYIGSVEAMGKIHNDVHDEQDGFHPEHALIPYGASKAKASLEVEKFSKQYNKEHTCSVSIVSPGGISGPYDDGSSDVGRMVKMFMSRKLSAYPSKGGFCFVDVRDVANTVVLLTETLSDRDYYLVAGEYVDVKSLMNILEIASGIPKPKFAIPLWFMYCLGAIVETWTRIFGGHPIFTTGSVCILCSCLQVSSKKSQVVLGIRFRSIQESFNDQVRWYKEKEAVLD